MNGFAINSFWVPTNIFFDSRGGMKRPGLRNEKVDLWDLPCLQKAASVKECCLEIINYRKE